MAEEKIEIITETEHCRHVVSSLARETVLAVDCQGIRLSASGPLTLLQVATFSGDVYLFDLQENKNLLSKGRLARLLESSEIVKVMNDCSYNSAALFNQFHTNLQNVFDTQVVEMVLQEHKGRLLAPLLKTQQCKSDGYFWSVRPFTDDMLYRAAHSVRVLIPELYLEKRRYIEQHELERTFEANVLESVYLYIRPEVKKERQRRMEDRVKQIIDSINENWIPNTKLSDFSENGDELLALKNINHKEAVEKSEFINRLKTESLLQELKELEKKITTAEIQNVLGKRHEHTFSFLSNIAKHQNETVSKLAKDIKDKLQNIVLDAIETYFSHSLRASFGQRRQQDDHRSLIEKSTSNLRFPANCLRLYWILKEEDLDRKIKSFKTNGEEFEISDEYYKEMEIYEKSTEVPRHLRQKIRKFKKQLSGL